MLSDMMRLQVLPVIALLLSVASCAGSQARPDGPVAIRATSDSLTVSGQYHAVALPAVDRVSLSSGALVLHGGAAAYQPVLPAAADTSRPTRNWALTTELDTSGDGRALTFTHNISVQDFTIELPVGEAEIRYGAFVSRDGGEIMILAWGANSKSYWGYLTISGVQSFQAAPGATVPR